MEDTKKCCLCQQNKILTEFNKCRATKDGLHNGCRECNIKAKREWNIKNKEHIKEYAKRPEVVERARINEKLRYDTNTEYRERILEKNRIRRRGDDAKAVARAYENKRRKENVYYKLRTTLASRVRMAINKIKTELNLDINKCASTIELLGCSIWELKTHLEKQFKPGMTWENHGFGDDKWHIDHILPCASFDLTKEEEQRKCFHYTNLQPLWQFDNLSKSDRII
jgi:hypothetical protein